MLQTDWEKCPWLETQSPGLYGLTQSPEQTHCPRQTERMAEHKNAAASPFTRKPAGFQNSQCRLLCCNRSGMTSAIGSEPLWQSATFQFVV